MKKQFLMLCAAAAMMPAFAQNATPDVAKAQNKAEQQAAKPTK
jgi:hypothetical protein